MGSKDRSRVFMIALRVKMPCKADCKSIAANRPNQKARQSLCMSRVQIRAPFELCVLLLHGLCVSAWLVASWSDLDPLNKFCGVLTTSTAFSVVLQTDSLVDHRYQPIVNCVLGSYEAPRPLSSFDLSLLESRVVVQHGGRTSRLVAAACQR